MNGDDSGRRDRPQTAGAGGGAGQPPPRPWGPPGAVERAGGADPRAALAALPAIPGRAPGETRRLLLERAERGASPFTGTIPAEAAAAIGRLGDDPAADPDAWARVFSALAEREAERGRRATLDGEVHAARQAHLRAYAWYRVGRFPAPTSAGKQQAWLRGQEQFLAAARFMDPPLERVKMSFDARLGEGGVVTGYLRRPLGAQALPVAVVWGGADAGKEDVAADPWLARNLATLAIDPPGVGEAPLVGSPDAERLWDAVLDWIERQADLDPDRVGVVGESIGGYWAVKLAHTHRDRIRAAVSVGGPVHYAFSQDWIEHAEVGEYPFGLAETVGRAFGCDDLATWLHLAPTLSLLDQGVLDEPSGPLLVVGGAEDGVVPIADQYLLLEHGTPKSARFFPGGHPGAGAALTAGVTSTVADWLAVQLEA